MPEEAARARVPDLEEELFFEGGMKLFASDLHIGHPSSNLEAIGKLLEMAKEAETFYLLGDTFELIWSDMDEIKLNHMGIVRQLGALGERLFICYGNHDPFNRLQLFGPLLGTKVSKQVVLDGYLLCHGDEFDLSIKALNTVAGRFYKYLPYFKGRLYKTPFQEKEGKERERFNLHIASITASALSHAERCHVAKVEPPGVENLKGIIFGHSHFPQDCFFPTLGVRLINTGDFVDSLTYVIMDDGKVEVKRI